MQSFRDPEAGVVNLSHSNEIYERILALLQQQNVGYQLIEHASEGRTDLASRIRGHRLEEAAKALVIAVKEGKLTRRHFLVVVSGDRRVDFDAVARLGGGRKATFATPERATELTGCVMGAVPPFSFHGQLELVVDPMLLEQERIVFNAGRLDRSISMLSEDYRNLIGPRIDDVALRVD